MLTLLLALGVCRADGPPRLVTLNVAVGMERAEVEARYAKLLGRKSDYSPYNNSMTRCVILYRDGDWVLEVTYKGGAPAPWIVNDDGSAMHMPPVDNKVEAFTLRLATPADATPAVPAPAE